MSRARRAVDGRPAGTVWRGRRGVRRVAATLVIASVWASTASAQAPQERPFRGLFGGGEAAAAEQGQAASATLSVFQAYDTNLLVDQAWGALLDPRYRLGGPYSGANLDLSYAANSRPIRLAARAGGDVQYSPESRLSMITPAASASILLNVIERPGATIRAQQGVGYLPYRFLSLLPQLSDAALDTVSAPGVDFAIATVVGYDYRSDLSADFQLGPTSSMGFGYGRTATEYRGAGGGLTEDRLFGRFVQRLSRDAALRLGYGERRASYPNAPPRIRTHELDIGLDFRRAISLTRRTSIGFSTGATAMRPEERRLEYYLTGSASLSHEMGRSWGALVAYNRALQFQEGLAVPFLADAVSAQLGGYLGRRAALQLTAGVAVGTSDPSAIESRYLTHTEAARLRVALNRYSALYVEAFQYFYRFTNPAPVLGALPAELERLGVRGGFTLLLPLLR